MKLKTLLGTVIVASAMASGARAVCDPTTFMPAEIANFSFSDAMTLSAWDVMNETNPDFHLWSFNLGSVIYGSSVVITAREAKAVAAFMKRASGLDTGQAQTIELLRINPSFVGDRMMADCRARMSTDFSVDFPAEAYAGEDFVMTVTYTSPLNLPNGTTSVPAEVRLVNGKVDGSPVAKQPVARDLPANFVISREAAAKALQIVVTVGGHPYNGGKPIILPAVKDLFFQAVTRTWPQDKDTFLPLCSDDGGGTCGSDAHSNKVCLMASGVMLPSTISIQESSINPREPVIDAASDHVCITYSTRPAQGADGFGQKGYSRIDRFKFSIREVVPKRD